MSSRRPGRRRRERGSTLPGRSTVQAVAAGEAVPTSTASAAGRKREHHTKTDYRYVKGDLVTVAAVGGISMAFVIVMALIA